MARWRRRRRWGYRDWARFKPSVPRAVEGGIKAQTERGAFGKSWWGRRWIEVLETFYMSNRLHRGRAYARKGQVLSIENEPGKTTARVQGSRGDPYRISIRMKSVTPEGRKRLGKALSKRALFAAKLAAGEMPQDIDKVFREAGTALFPRGLDEIKTHCSCPDSSNPCKHIAAVYYLLGEEFDRDPFLIFKLRGIERDELLERTGREPSAGKGKARPRRPAGPETAPAPKRPAEPLPSGPDEYWGTESALEWPKCDLHAPKVQAALPKRLGNFPFWRAEKRFLAAMESMYREASPLGLKLLAGEAEAPSPRPSDQRSSRSGRPARGRP